MGTFRYKALTEGGKIVRGNLEGATQAAVAQELRTQGHYPLSLIPEGQASGLIEFLNRPIQLSQKFSGKHLALATQELATLLKAGLELDRCLEILSSLDDLRSLKEPLAEVRKQVRDGASLGEALNNQSVFPRFYVSMVRAGEHGGNLEPTLRRLADYLTKSRILRETITSALVYPLILLVTAGFSIIFILLFVLPEFESLFSQAGKSLPPATQFLMDMGRFLRGYWWLLGLIIAGGIYWFRNALRDPKFLRRVHFFLLRLPLFGPLLRDIQIERFSRTLGTLVGNGVALPTALSLAKEVMWSEPLKEVVGNAAVSLREGESLAQRLSKSRLFPSLTIDLIHIGEQSGKLDEMLLRQAELDEHRIQQKVNRLMVLLTPTLTIILGFMVAGLIASLMSAIFSLNDLAIQ